MAQPMRGLRSNGTHPAEIPSLNFSDHKAGARFSMQDAIPEISTSSKKSMRRKWQIAWVHNGNAGGSKRFAFEMVRNLSARGHVIDEFIVRGSESNGDYLPLKPFVRTSSEVIVLNPDLSWLRPYLLSSYVQLGATLWTMRKVEREFEQLANVINATEYDFVHIDQYPTCRAVGILPYLQRPSVVYSHEPSSVRYEESSRDTSVGQNSAS